MPSPKIFVNGKLENKVLNKMSVANSVLDDHVIEKTANAKTASVELRKKIKAERKKSGK